jgi:hypothetical protein
MTEDKLTQSLAILNPIRTVELKDKTGNFEAILQGLLSDLETPNTLSVLLCEQIAESIFWMRRHVEDKELILLEATAEKIDKAQSGYHSSDMAYTAEDIKQVLLGDETFKQKINDELKDTRSNSIATSFDGCRAKAFVSCAKEIRIADDLIQRQMLNIRHLQRSLDAIDMKSRIIRRMDIELERIERDLTILEHDPEAD